MVMCRAYPVKKPVPADRVTTASCCDGESFVDCPQYREALERAERKAATGDGLTQAQRKRARP
jgi:hypothetical protein